MMENLTTIKEVNILGYSGSYLSLLFESLSANGFKGTVNIFMNDHIKRADNTFETSLDYKIFHFSEVDPPPKTGFILCSNKPSTKLFLVNFFQEKWNIEISQMLSFWHPSSIIASSVKPGHGFYVEPLSVVSPYVKIGNCVTVNRNCSVGHHNILHDFCSIHPGSNLSGSVEVGEAAEIGPGCTVFNAVKIGKNTVIGGGSVVTKDIPDNVLAFGNPCKVVKTLK